MLKIVNSFSLFSKFVICLILVTKRVFLVFEKFEYRKHKIFYLLNRALIISLDPLALLDCQSTDYVPPSMQFICLYQGFVYILLQNPRVPLLSLLLLSLTKNLVALVFIFCHYFEFRVIFYFFEYKVINCLN